MRIENLRSERVENRARVAATVIWEDCDRPTQEVYFETEEAFAGSLSCNPHAFLLGCIIPAMHYGEERIFLDAEICPELQNGLLTATSWLRHWYHGPDRKPICIEVKTRSGLPTPRTVERAGFFFSGGIDSFATLRANRLNFPAEHPGSIKDGLLVYGLEMDKPESFEYVVNSLSKIGQEIGITFIPVYTNLYLHYRQEDAENKFDFWRYKFQGAALSAVAHAFAQRLTTISIAATFDISNLEIEGHLHSWGSHPLLDPNYSSVDLRVRHDGITLSRLAKTKLIADWDVALQNLRVCNLYKHYQPGQLNCGQCEKCIRTMLELLALGVLDRSCAFPEQNVSEEIILEKVSIKSPYMLSCYEELIAPLMKKGRHDLVRAIEYKITQYHNQQKNNWKAMLMQLDRKYLNGNLAGFKKLVSSHN